MRKGDCYIGIDVGGTDIKAGLVSRDGTVLMEKKIGTEADQGVEHVLDRIGALIKSFIGQKSSAPVKSIGIGLPGQVDFNNGIVFEPPNLPGWIKVEAKREIERRIGLPVYLDNDANLAALGEHAFGAGRGTNEMLMVTLGTGVGGGLILCGKVYRGAVGGAGEFGHMIIVKDGPLCGCGRRGCIEAFVGKAGILRRVNEKRSSGHASVLDRMDLLQLTPKDIYEAAKAGDTAAGEVMKDTGVYLGIGLGNVANLLNLERMVVGGGVANAGEMILGPARLTMKEVAQPVSRDLVEVVPAVLGNQAGVVGAARLAMLENL